MGREAIELLAVVLRHPASKQHALGRPARVQEEAEQLRAELEAELGAEAYEVAWQRGHGLQLEGAVAKLLAGE